MYLLVVAEKLLIQDVGHSADTPAQDIVASPSVSQHPVCVCEPHSLPLQKLTLSALLSFLAPFPARHR